jgi:hypothetical protein
MEDPSRCSEYADKDSLPNKNPWDNKEERRTISGYLESDAYEADDTYDPICDNCFHLYESVSRHIQVRPTITKPVPCAALSKQTPHRSLMHRKVLQPMVKVVPYRPRLSHWGYRSDISQKDERMARYKLSLYHRALSFKLDWPKQYMIP